MKMQSVPHALAKEYLLKCDLLSGVSETTIEGLLRDGTTRTYEEGAFIIAHEDDSSSLIFVLDGRVSIERLVDDRVLSIIQRGSGEVVGEIACITGEPRSADVRTLMTTVVLKIGSKQAQKLMEQDHVLAMNMMKLLALKLRQSIDISTTSSLKLAQKLALEIYSEFKRDRIKISPSVWMLPHKVTQNEWANRVGARRESVNRVFRQFTEEGILDFQEGKLCLLDRDALLSFAST